MCLTGKNYEVIKMIYNKGINDMKRGWASENEKNHKIYQTWINMLCRCYSEKYHEKRPTYKGCIVCKRWLLLSNFVEDFSKIDGYDEKLFLSGKLCLDKDIKSNGKKKEYSLKNCMLVSKSENSRQVTKTMDYSFIQGENNPRSVKIAQYDKQGNLIKIWSCSEEIQRELKINNNHIITCCKFYKMNCNREKWFKSHKDYPHKSAGGYVWKYYEE